MMMSSSNALRLEPAVSPARPAEERIDPYDLRAWEVEFLRMPEFLRGRSFGISDKAMTVRFPVRMLRYWFTYHLLIAEYRRARRPGGF